jgi:NADH-quinone oxidoreductase subunit N
MLFGFLSLSLLPEVILAVGILTTLMTGCFIKNRLIVWVQAIATLAVCLLALILLDPSSISINNSHIISDSLSKTLQIGSVITVILVLLYSKFWIENDNYLSYEAVVLTLITLLGSWIVIASQHFVMLFVGIELMSLPLYALVAIRSKAEDDNSSYGVEAALKYFITGSMASACLLYGLSLIFGATGFLDYANILKVISSVGISDYSLVIGIIFIVAALGFKFGLFPFHMWVPDVYQGAPLSVTFLIATLPKIAYLGFVIRFFGGVITNSIATWEPLFICLGVGSIIIGNCLAFLQTNLLRLLGYSSIAHMGVLCLSFIIGGAQGWQAAQFYILTYVLTISLVFGTLAHLNYSGSNCKNIVDLKGLSKLHPTSALMLLIGLFSLAGVPPLVGFLAKFSIVKVLIINHLNIAVIVVLMSCVGCYYYIKLIREMYFEEGLVRPQKVIYSTSALVLVFNAGLVLLVGVVPILLTQFIS